MYSARRCPQAASSLCGVGVRRSFSDGEVMAHPPYVSLPVSMFGKGDFYILRAKGDSMVDAGIDEDDLLVIERNCPALEGDVVVALDEDNQNTLKRYAGYDKDSGYYILEYENEARYPGKTIKVRSFQVQGVARHVIKSL